MLAGLSGPATYGAARAANEILDSLPPAETGRNSAVLWAVVETAVETDEDLPADQRTVRGQKIIDGPHFSLVD